MPEPKVGTGSGSGARTQCECNTRASVSETGKSARPGDRMQLGGKKEGRGGGGSRGGGGGARMPRMENGKKRKLVKFPLWLRGLRA